jgi:pseudaminic acid biosynthesis-associated methylase
MGPAPDDPERPPEVARLEALWGEEFGDRYIERNRDAAEGRDEFWNWLYGAFPFDSVLEVGCNVGGNLRWLAELLPPRSVYGVDINERALLDARAALPGVNLVHSSARSLPFRDAAFDLTFTTTVLIHQTPEAAPIAMSEVVRCSRRYVLCGEYFSEALEEVPYRGERGALFKRDWGQLYADLFPELRLLERTFRGAPWDDVTFWLFEKPAGPARSA